MRRGLFLLAALAFSIGTLAARADDGLVTELGKDHVDITSRFTGEHILIFGAMSRPGDVIIKVQSPEQGVSLSRKVPVGPVWLDSGKLPVAGAPGLVYLLSSRPPKDVLDRKTRDQLGLRFQDALAAVQVPTDDQGMTDWREAFVRLKQSGGYYLEADHAVRLTGNRLFSATLALPANIPLGEYKLDIFLVKDGKVISHDTHTLDVQQVQLEHWVAATAHNHPWTFGVSFVALAMLLGLGLGMALRRDSDD